MSLLEDALPGMRPGDSRSITEDGHTFRVTATGQTGCDTGRRRYRVECLTCQVEVHESTTGPMQQIGYHLRNKDEA